MAHQKSAGRRDVKLSRPKVLVFSGFGCCNIEEGDKAVEPLHPAHPWDHSKCPV